MRVTTTSLKPTEFLSSERIEGIRIGMQRTGNKVVFICGRCEWWGWAAKKHHVTLNGVMGSDKHFVVDCNPYHLNTSELVVTRIVEDLRQPRRGARY